MVEIRLESPESKSPRIQIIRMFLVDLWGVLGRVALAGGGGATTVFLCSDCKPSNSNHLFLAGPNIEAGSSGR
jgi:hypothetical protein